MEAITKIEFGVKLHPNGHARTDGVVNGREVQIKATQGKEVVIKKHIPGDFLIIIKINRDGSWEKIYAGDSERVWSSLQGKKESYLREKTIPLKRLQALQACVGKDDCIEHKRLSG